MPRREGVRSDPGREREREKNRAAGANSLGVIEKRLEPNAAPSGSLEVTGGTATAMTELRGNARPRMPLNFGERGSLAMSFAAAILGGVN